MPNQKEPKVKYSDDQIQELLKGLYNGTIDEYNIPESLYLATAEYLMKAVELGFEDFEGKDIELFNELRENVYMFSAAKSYQQLKDIGSLMFDEDGNRVSINEFSELGVKKFSEWTDAYGRSEYNTAVASATTAVKWQEVEDNKDILGVLEYEVVDEDYDCDICTPLDGLRANVDDAIWNTVTAPNHFNCRCIIKQLPTDTELTPKSEKNAIFKDVDKEMDDTFKYNPGREKVIFSEDHPYFQVPKEDRKFAEENFGLSIPKPEK